MSWGAYLGNVSGEAVVSWAFESRTAELIQPSAYQPPCCWSTKTSFGDSVQIEYLLKTELEAPGKSSCAFHPILTLQTKSLRWISLRGYHLPWHMHHQDSHVVQQLARQFTGCLEIPNPRRVHARTVRWLSGTAHTSKDRRCFYVICKQLASSWKRCTKMKGNLCRRLLVG